MSEYVPPTLEESGSVGIGVLENRHYGATAYIVAKGPSIRHLRASHFGPGFVITINEAVAVVQDLGLPMQVYAMQKDGCEVFDADNEPRPCGSCEPLGWIRPPLVNPRPGIAAVFSQHLSSWCLKGRPNRYVFTDAQFGYPGQPLTMSVLEAIPLARFLGAAAIVMMCFDSLTTGDLTTPFSPTFDSDARQERMRYNLEWVKPRTLAALQAFGPHSFFTPPEQP